MSAFVLSHDHINYLVQAASQLAVVSRSNHYYHYHDGTADTYSVRDSDAIGRMLCQENINSVQYRYPDDAPFELPGPIPTPIAERFSSRPTYVPVKTAQILKACKSYEYQSCEHPEWESSRAKAFIDWLTATAISSMPGYDDAMWEVEEPARTLAAPIRLI